LPRQTSRATPVKRKQPKRGTKVATKKAGARRDPADSTRERLLRASREVFERDGYINARVADIVLGAGVAHGTFYTYFDSKEDVFKVVAGLVVEEVLESLHVSRAHATTKERISAANSDYLKVYERHAVMLGLIVQVATYNEEFRRLRLDLRDRFVERIARAFDRFAEDPANRVYDSWVAASALGGMVDDLAYTWFVLGQKLDRKVALRTVDTIWFRALNLD
jgi:AcrR family transcriptional regulator